MIISRFWSINRLNGGGESGAHPGTLHSRPEPCIFDYNREATQLLSRKWRSSTNVQQMIKVKVYGGQSAQLCKLNENSAQKNSSNFFYCRKSFNLAQLSFFIAFLFFRDWITNKRELCKFPLGHDVILFFWDFLAHLIPRQKLLKGVFSITSFFGASAIKSKKQDLITN